jgi:uncharacterized membrane protein
MHPVSVEHHRGFFLSRVLSVLWSFPAVCFTLTLVTDITYWRTTNLIWAEASSWLLFAGMIVGVIASAIWLIAAIAHAIPRNWSLGCIGLVVLLLGLFNSLIHAGDGWTAIVPWGLVVSALTVILLLVGFLVPVRQPVHPRERRLA